MPTPNTPKRTILLGRSSECDVIINHPEVSGRHAFLSILPDGAVEIKDAGSRNGTFINGERVLNGILRPGDKLSFGSQVIDWEAILRDPPPPIGGSGSPTRSTRVPFKKETPLQTLLWVIIAVIVVGAILWFFVKPWVFQPK
ncbi:MAG: FHA domain-containing protein [Bacteroidia bacterium]|nr:FHA domain-containing protein [Bacteroidia bacterium]MCX7652911.1 FHA domain-containing protein [Bacteroidia bacterium]MDW8416621.1 FHA domain-containing protein [Bacteroidia bacterium]